MKIEKVIFGRLNSERLPKKLLLDLHGTNLWEIACKKFPDAYFICCDDELIKIALDNNCKVIKRDIRTTQADEPLNYIFKDIKQIDATHILWINPCLALLSKETVDEAINYAIEVEADYMESIRKFNNWLYCGEGNLITQVDFRKLNTKNMPCYWQGAHAFRLFPKRKFIDTGKMLDDEHEVFPVPEDECIDVDTKLDYEVLKCLLQK